MSGRNIYIYPLAVDKPPSKNTTLIRASIISARVFDKTIRLSTE
jgi:hypothetical protein